MELIQKEIALFDRYEAVFKLLARLHLIPGNTNALKGRMNENSHSYIRAEEEQPLTLIWHCVGQTHCAAI